MRTEFFQCIDEDSKKELLPSLAGLMLGEAIRSLDNHKSSLDEEGLNVLTELNEIDNSRAKEIGNAGSAMQERSMADLHFLKTNAEKIRELHKKAKELIGTI
ncbi:MAG: hypothetical protein UT37_C0003G0019 [Parcubacteria group bacterium GW2011_GWA2_39_18]|nr:MAG: hypothetical protein UT37_C0003G0019 [Parcubacteria group bacterium GW2011_GWA2_39_18]